MGLLRILLESTLLVVLAFIGGSLAAGGFVLTIFSILFIKKIIYTVVGIILFIIGFILLATAERIKERGL